jgi:hypothetical protein
VIACNKIIVDEVNQPSSLPVKLSRLERSREFSTLPSEISGSGRASILFPDGSKHSKQRFLQFDRPHPCLHPSMFPSKTDWRGGFFRDAGLGLTRSVPVIISCTVNPNEVKARYREDVHVLGRHQSW